MTDHNTIMNPQNRREQIESTLRFVLDNPALYESLLHNPRRLEAAALKLFVSGYGMTGYHADVIRCALRDLDAHGLIEYDSAPYTMEE